MKKLMILMLSLALLTACNAPPQMEPAPIETPAVSAAPEYPQFSVYDTASLDGLNLDGVGNRDDSAMAIQYYLSDADGEFSVAFTVLQVTLGTGTTWVKKYEGFRYSDLSFGYLTNLERVCIVLQLTSRTSNYAATDIHVLELWEDSQHAGAWFLGECLTLLDGCTEYDKPSDPYPFLFRVPDPDYCAGESYSKYLTTLTMGGGVVAVADNPLQALQVMTYAPMQETVGHVLRWDGVQWYVDGMERQTLATIPLDGLTLIASAPTENRTTILAHDLDGDGTEEHLAISSIVSAPYCSLSFQKDSVQYQVNVLELLKERFPEWQYLHPEKQVSGDGNGVWLDFTYWLDGDGTEHSCRVIFTGDSLLVTE